MRWDVVAVVAVLFSSCQKNELEKLDGVVVVGHEKIVELFVHSHVVQRYNLSEGAYFHLPRLQNA